MDARHSTADQPALGEKYRLIRQLEVGGMGSVWLARHVALDSLVAVKLISREVAATPAGTERFLREARTAASLRSPNVVQILDYGVHEGIPFIAMELLEGESLAARLAREGRFQSWEGAERVLRYVARAVGRAHAAGIVHRDLKPANIFLVPDEEEQVVKLLDFGIAKAKAPLAAAPGSNTRTGEFLGSPAYASPEQLQASKDLDQRADIWSLGVIAYECFIGRCPFAADTLVNQVLAICMEPLPVPSEQGPVPPGFDAWFARACARDVEQRFQSVREAAAELRRLVAAACGVALPPSEPESKLAGEGARIPESIPAVQTPPSTPATLLQAGFSGTPLSRWVSERKRADVTRRGPGAPRSDLIERPVAALWMGLGALAAVLTGLLAWRALVAPDASDQSVLGLGSAPAPAGRSEEPRSGDPRAEEPRVEIVPSVEAVPSVGESVPHAETLPAPERAPALEPAIGDALPQGAAGASASSAQPGVPAAPEPSRPAPPKAPVARGSVPQGSRAWLTITASAPASVVLDGIPIGTTPVADVAVEPGAHEVVFLHDGGRSAETIRIGAGEHKRVAARLAAAPAGGLDEAAVQRTLRRNGAAVRDECWQAAVSGRAPGDPTSARVTATLTVERSGRVQSVATSGVPVEYPELARCIEEKLSHWTFRPSAGETVVNVPFVFVTE